MFSFLFGEKLSFNAVPLERAFLRIALSEQGRRVICGSDHQPSSVLAADGGK